MTNIQKQSLKESVQNKLASLESRLEILQKELRPLKKSCAYDDAEYSSLCQEYDIRYKEMQNLQQKKRGSFQNTRNDR